MLKCTVVVVEFLTGFLGLVSRWREPQWSCMSCRKTTKNTRSSRNQTECYPSADVQPNRKTQLENPLRAHGNGQQRPTDPGMLGSAADAATDELGTAWARGKKAKKTRNQKYWCYLLTARQYTIAVLKLSRNLEFKHRGSRDAAPPRHNVLTERAKAGWKRLRCLYYFFWTRSLSYELCQFITRRINFV